MPTPPLDRHLVAPSCHCTSPLPSPPLILQRLQQITFQFGHI
jgi:hypothetical protein